MRRRLPKAVLTRPKTGLAFDPFLEAVKQVDLAAWRPEEDAIDRLQGLILKTMYYTLLDRSGSVRPRESGLVTNPMMLAAWIYSIEGASLKH